jgi:hypothetical protein
MARKTQSGPRVDTASASRRLPVSAAQPPAAYTSLASADLAIQLRGVPRKGYALRAVLARPPCAAGAG